MSLTLSLVAGLAASGRDDIALAGGKGANLGELVRAGYAVPDGFVVSTEAYAAAVREAGLAGILARGAADGNGATIRAAFERVTLPDHLAEEIVGAYRSLGGGAVAVRSSATAEDLPGAAFAGQQDTYLDVSGEEALLDAVRRCWGSLWTDRAIAYRRRLGIGSEEVALAVVVQRMIAAEFAGVMFTANPVTGARDEVVVDVAEGLGDAVVSGTVTPDHLVIDARGAVRERRLGDGARHLAEPVIVELATVGRSVAAHYGRPQDIEWAYADGCLWLTQARPMTALPPPPLRLSRFQRLVGAQLLDYVTVRPYPLDMSAWTGPAIGRLVERMLAEIPGLRVDFAGALPERDGVVERFVPPSPRPTTATLTAPARLLRRVRRHRPARWTDDPRFTTFRREVGDLSALDLPGLGWSELVTVPRRALAVHETVADLRVDYLPRAGLDLARLRAVLGLLGLGRLFPLLILGGRTRTEDANRALARLADRVRDDASLHAVFAISPPPELAHRIEEDPAFADFRTALADFRAEYGHRETTSLLVMSSPTWGDDLGAVLGLVRMLVTEPAQPARAAESRPTRTEEARRRLLDHRMVRLTRTGAAVDRVVDGARAGIAFREDSHFYATAVLPVVRGSLLEAGARLAAADVLGERDDVLHLRLEEIEALPDPLRLPRAEVRRVRALARQRAVRRAELDGVPLIAMTALFPTDDAEEADVLVSGTPAGAGRATGAVRLVTGPADFAALRPGEVLVCPYTNPAWTPLFQRAAAVVVDSGGLGSHAAIVAREYGIPAVMGTGRGTAVLAFGQRVTVDGDRGRVTPA